MKLTYVGPHEAVDVVDADGRTLAVVERGKSEELPAAIAASLLEQGPEHWQHANRKAKAAGTEEAK